MVGGCALELGDFLGEGLGGRHTIIYMMLLRQQLV